MLSEIFIKDRPYLERKFKQEVCDPASGLDNETLKKNLMVLAENLEGMPHEVIKAQAFAYVCENVRIDVNPQDYFVAFGCWDRDDRPLSQLIGKWNNQVDEKLLKVGQLMNDQNKTGSSVMWKDFDHSVPDWDAVFTLGFPGLLARARQYRRKREERGELTDTARAYFDGIEITYTANYCNA